MCFTAEGQVRTSASLRTDGTCQRSYICSKQAGTHLPGPCSRGIASCSHTLHQVWAAWEPREEQIPTKGRPPLAALLLRGSASPPLHLASLGRRLPRTH